MLPSLLTGVSEARQVAGGWTTVSTNDSPSAPLTPRPWLSNWVGLNPQLPVPRIILELASMQQLPDPHSPASAPQGH